MSKIIERKTIIIDLKKYRFYVMEKYWVVDKVSDNKVEFKYKDNWDIKDIPWDKMEVTRAIIVFGKIKTTQKVPKKLAPRKWK